jgi:outer membrane lipopolysaccharide assembly protein LptE/RlpB
MILQHRVTSMKNKTTALAVLALLGVSFVITGCPYHHRPHAPHPHRLPHLRLPLDSMLQLERQNNAVMLSGLQAGKPAAPRIE